jgi:NADPH-dependent 2,4-dienoyl-CoA reductase/sulfur reductase-like enzyme
LHSRFFAATFQIVYKGVMEATDITIIGAGVIGLAIAAEIAKPGLTLQPLSPDM